MTRAAIGQVAQFPLILNEIRALHLHELPSDLMGKPRHSPRRSILVIALSLALPALSFGQIKVLMSGGFAVAYQELLPQFEKDTGIIVTTTRGRSQGEGADTIGGQLRGGVHADLVIMNREGLDQLISEGRVLAGTEVDLARVPLGLAVRHGAAKPEIGTVDTFKQALLRASSIYSDSSARIYIITKMLPQLGVADTVSSKMVNKGASAAVRGESDLVILPASELLAAQDTDFVGIIPAEIQHVSVFTAALVTGSNRQEAAKRLINFLTSQTATAAIRKSGMQPANSQE